MTKLTATSDTVSSPIEISALISCYFEEQSIEEFYTRLSKSLRDLGRPYEIIFVNDGSTDATWEKLKAIHESDPNVSTVIDFTRNFGQAAAKTAAIQHARGKMLLLLDSDLQLDPEEIPSLASEFDNGYQIVSGYRKERKDSLLRTLPSLFANMAMRRVAGHPLKDFGCTFKIYDRSLVDAFEFGPFKPWRPIYVFSRTNSVKEVPVSHHPRRYGKSGWSPKRLVVHLFDILVGVSQRPFQLLSIACMFFAGLLLLRLMLSFFFEFQILDQVTNGLLLNVLLLQLLFILGLLTAIGEYTIRNFVTLQNYPAYVVREIATHLSTQAGK